MAKYVEVSEAIQFSGLRLVLSAGFPGPWGEAAKAILYVKQLPYTKVRQYVGMPNPELKRWTGRDNAPIAVSDDEGPRDGWAEILFLAERLAPEPSLIPDTANERILMFGLSREICGENGFGWMRRLMSFHPLISADPPLPDAALEIPRRLSRKYGYSTAAVDAAPRRIAEILGVLSERLLAQRSVGSRYFIGRSLTALDLYWAAFALMLEPMPDALCSLPAAIRSSYRLTDPEVRKAADPLLLEHRDFIYRTHLELPMDF